MNKLILLVSILTFSFTANAQMDIADVRNMAEGTTVTIEGVVTNGAELSIIRYVQDATGAIAAYPGTGSVANFPDNVKRGDLVEITGALKSFNGLLEIDPITDYEIISSNNALPMPELVTPNGINEANEAKLIRVEEVKFDNGGSKFGVGNFTFTASNGERGEIYVRSGHPLLGEDITLANVNLTGIASEFSGNYQLLLRDMSDIEIADNFYFTSSLQQSNLTKEGFDLAWSTNAPGSTKVVYGTDPDDLGQELTAMGTSTDHAIALTGLEAGTIYFVQAISSDGAAEVKSKIGVFATASNSSGTIRVYFNHGVDGSFSSGSYPTNTTPNGIEQAIINRIKNAKSTIDVAAYNNNRETLVAALTEAHNNGIQVRYVADDETLNSALKNPAPPFTVIYGNSGDPLMHNKFIVIDADSEDESWVFSGSTNLTTQNIAQDFNNSIFIQDQALARAYKLEFEEMWGGDSPTPLIANLKFGEDKADNTPHLFDVNGVIIESYFSPSDNTTANIVNTLATADTDLEFSLLSFTQNELGTAVRNVHSAGVSVRGIVEMANGTGSEVNFLQNEGVNVVADNLQFQMHHKYAIVDATNPASDPLVITGSHNWSANAENNNDENTLIIHDADIANIFLQEFEARWCEVNSGANCITSTGEIEIEGFEVTLSPNPASDVAVATMEIANTSDLTIALMDVNGRVLQTTILKKVQGAINEELLVSGLATGMYVVLFKINDQITSRPLMVTK